MEEIQIPSEEIQIPSFDEQFADYSNRARKQVLQRDAAKNLIGNRESLEEYVRDTSLSNHEEIKNKGVEEYYSKTNSLDAQILEDAAVASPDFGVEVANVMETHRQKERTQDPLFIALKNNVLNTPGSEKLSSQQVDHFAADMLHLYGVAQSWDELGFFGKVGDFANLMLLPDTPYNVGAVAEGLSETFGIEDWKTDGFSHFELVQQMSSYRRSLEGEALLAFDEKTRELLDDIEGSVLQKTQFLEVMTGQYGDFGFDLAMDKADIAITVGTLGGAFLYRILRAGQMVKRLADIGDKQGAMAAADAAAADKEAAKLMGQSQVDAASTGNPMVDKSITHGVPEAPSNELRHYDSNLDDVLDRVWNVASINLATETPEEAVRVAAALRKHLPDDLQIDNVKIEQKGGQTLIEYDIKDENGTTITRESIPYTLDEVGSYQDESVGFGGSALRFVFSPTYIQGEDAKQLVDSALVGINAKAKLGKIYTEAAELALKPIKGNKKSMERLRSVFNELDGKHIEGDPYHVLTNVGIGGVRLSEKEFAAWQGVRRVLDDLYIQNDRAMIQELELGRAKQITTPEDEVIFARPYESPESAEAAWHQDQNSIRLARITDDGIEEVRGTSLKDLEEEYKSGYVLVRSHVEDSSTWFRAGDVANEVRYRFALVPGNRISRLPPSGVMNKVPNYLPKLNKEANFFIKEERMVDVGGREKISKPITLAYASTYKQAEAYRKALLRSDAEMGIERTILEVKEDVLKTSQSNGDATKAMGGLVRGKRSKEGIEYAGNLGGGRADPLESITRAINITADRMAMSRWRLAEMERWYNSAKEVVSDLPSDWMMARTAIENLAPSPMKTKLLSAHDHMSSMRMIPTKSEKMFQGAIVSAAKLLDKSDNKFLQKSAAYFYQIKDHNPVGLIKSMTFNLTLGTFSMVQIPVQTFGALVAVGANPVYAGRAMPSWIMASGLDLGRDLKVVKDTASILGKRMGMNPEEIKTFKNDYAFWRDAGMREAVIRGNADATAMMNGLPMDAGMLRRVFQSFLTAGQTPYRIGELANMRISFFTALERQKAVDGASFVYDNNTMKKVLSRAEHYRMNMHSANKAAFQRGVWALPTQFKQIYTKYIEALAGKEFTPAEKLRILGVQASVFGAAGIPILNHFTNEVVKHTGIMEGDPDHETLMVIHHGAMAHVMNNMFDIDMASSGRLTVSADLIDEIIRIGVEGRTPLWEIMMGASGTPMKHGVGFFNSLLLAGNMVYAAEEIDPATLTAAAKIASDGLLRISSSGRKAIEAMDLTEGWVRKSDGTPIYEVYDPQTRDIFFRASGFGSLATEEMYKERNVTRNIEEERRGRVDQLISAWYTIVRGAEKEDYAQWKAGQLAASMVRSQIDRLPRDEAERVMDAFLKKLLDGTDMMDETIRKSVETFYTDSMNAYNSSLPTIAKYRQEQAEDGREIIKGVNR